MSVNIKSGLISFMDFKYLYLAEKQVLTFGFLFSEVFGIDVDIQLRDAPVEESSGALYDLLIKHDLNPMSIPIKNIRWLRESKHTIKQRDYYEQRRFNGTKRNDYRTD